MWIFRTSTPGTRLATSRRDLDASKRGRDDPDPKTRMLGLTPISVFGVDPAGKRKSWCLWRPLRSFLLMYGQDAKDDENQKRVCHFFGCEIKKRAKKTGKAKGVRSHEESEIEIISKHVSLKRQIKEV